MAQQNHSPKVQGALAISVGVLLLLYVLGFIQTGISVLLGAIAVGLIVYGIFASGMYTWIKEMTAKKR